MKAMPKERNSIITARDMLSDKLSKWKVELFENETQYLFRFTYKHGRGLVDNIYRNKEEVDSVGFEVVADSVYGDFVYDLLDFFLDGDKEE